MSWLSDILKNKSSGEVSKTKLLGAITSIGAIAGIVYPPAGTFITSHGAEIVMLTTSLASIFIHDHVSEVKK